MKKSDYKNLLNASIGLQGVDHLTVSQNFYELSEDYLSNKISFNELEKKINKYYQIKGDREDRSQEAELVSIRIFDELCVPSFKLDVFELEKIHEHLFKGIYKRAGKLRDYNITKKEWVLAGDTVIYGDYYYLYETLKYDLEKEKKFDYKHASFDEKISHLADFIANLWQIHPFCEGNTRTITVFFIKYLMKLGFEINNEPFNENSWYFRNCLVRANYSNISRDVYEDKTYLIDFLRAILCNEKHEFHNRNLLITKEELLHIAFSNNEIKVYKEILKNKNITQTMIASNTGLSRRTVVTIMQRLVKRKLVKRVGSNKYGKWVAMMEIVTDEN